MYKFNIHTLGKSLTLIPSVAASLNHCYSEKSIDSSEAWGNLSLNGYHKTSL